jgi:hypothetical protein
MVSVSTTTLNPGPPDVLEPGSKGITSTTSVITLTCLYKIKKLLLIPNKYDCKNSLITKILINKCSSLFHTRKSKQNKTQQLCI